MRLVQRLILTRYGIAPDSVLNPNPQPRDAMASVKLGAELRRTIAALIAQGLEAGDGRVDYDRLHRSALYREYQACAGRLRTFDPAWLIDDHERLAFWINLYNALVINAVVHFGIGSSVKQVPGFFWRAAYDIGGRRYDLTDIEHGILRANRGHPAIPGPHFGEGDPRRAFSLARLEPRIHFALVCAARSCPRITAYDPANLDYQLDLAARAFLLGGGVRIDRARGEVRLSRIFQWYAPDFGARTLAIGDRAPLLRYISSYLGDKSSEDYVLGKRRRVRFMDYDWSLNQSIGPSG